MSRHDDLKQPYWIPLTEQEVECLRATEYPLLMDSIVVTISPLGRLDYGLSVKITELADALDHQRYSGGHPSLKGVQTRLMEQRILRLACAQLNDPQQAAKWYTLWPIPSLDNLCAKDLVNDHNRGNEVERFLFTEGLHEYKDHLETLSCNN